MTTSETLQSPAARLLAKRQVCDRLSIGESKFKDLIRSGDLRTVRIGRCVRVSDAEIARFIAEREAAQA